VTVFAVPQRGILCAASERDIGQFASDGAEVTEDILKRIRAIMDGDA